jgi:hypothetical protein
MSPSELADIVDEPPYTTVDTPMMLGCMAQSRAIYETATFDKAVRAQLPHLQVWEVTGDATASFGLAALWTIEADDKARGNNHVKYKMVPGANHFVSLMMWSGEAKLTDRSFHRCTGMTRRQASIHTSQL